MQKADMRIQKCLVVVCVVLLLFALSSHAVSENKTAVFPVIQQTYKTDDLPDKDQLAEDFISNLMSGRPSGTKKDSRRGASLSGTEGNLYSLLLNDITSIANGERSSTILEYDASAVYPKTEYTKEDLGVDAILDEDMQFTQAAIEALDKIIVFNLDSVISSLLYTCPYELYWYDKTQGVSVSFPDQISANQNAVYIEGTVTFRLCVCEEYRLNGEMYLFDTTFGAGAVAAAAKAGEIVAKYNNGYTDEGILRGYASEICDLVSYNFDALDDGTPYGNPWQLVWVFDENPATNVVCEGYSKAFQYLCNRTSFSGNIHVITVTGTMDGGTGAGRHMWNVVKLNDGYNYLVDVTNIDEDTIGYPDQLLLASFSSGNYTEGYTFITNGGTVSYEYDAAALSQYSHDELALYGDDSGNIIASGAIGTNAMWILYDDGLLLVKGSGIVNSGGWEDYLNQIKKIEFSSGISGIGFECPLCYMPMTEEIVFPETVTLINSSILKNPLLKRIEINGQITSLGFGQFENNPSLETIVLPNGLLSIGMFCFNGCTSLKNIIIPSTVETIEGEAFNNCSSLQSITIPKGTIGRFAFTSCSSLEQVILEEGVTSIGESAFSYCSSLNSINFPTTLTEIEQYAFRDCRNLTCNITIPDSMLKIENGTFENCAFSSVSLPDSIISIGDYAFYGCKQLTNISFGNSLQIIGTDAFEGCGFTSITLPESVEQISFWSKNAYSPLEFMYVDDNNQYYSDINGVLYNKDKTKLIYCPAKKSGELIVPDGVVEVSDKAFLYCNNLTSVQLPDSVVVLGTNTFCMCYHLESVRLPGNLETIPSYMCYQCRALQSIILPETLSTIEGYAFYGCTSLQEVILPIHLEYIGEQAFANCYHITLKVEGNEHFDFYDGMLLSKDGKTLVSVLSMADTIIHVPEGVQTIAQGCFTTKNDVQEVYLPDSVKIIDSRAFSGCTQLHTVSFGSGLTTISENAFNSCYNLTEISLPPNSISIGPSAFSDCISLESFYMPGIITNLGGTAFNSCTNLTNIYINSITQHVGSSVFESTAYYKDESNWNDGLLIISNWIVASKNISGHLTIPSGVIGLTDWAFFDNDNITEVSCPESLQYISERAFYHCSNLISVHLNDGVKYIGRAAFSCTNIDYLLLPASITQIGYDFFSGRFSFDGTTIVFMGNAPDFDEKALINNGKTTIYYPYNNHSWSGIIGSQLGDPNYSITDGTGNVTFFPAVTWIPFDPVTGNVMIEDEHHLVHHEGKEATCTDPGWYEYDTCEDEGCDYSTYEEIPALGHTLTLHEQVDSTCIATGIEAYWSCDVCEKLFSDEEAQNEIEAPIVIAKKAHTLTAHTKVDSTCAATGTEAYWSCDVCEKLFSDEDAQNEIEAPVVIGKKAHTLTAHAKVDSTCAATGTEAYWSCDVCEKMFSDEDAQNEIEAPIVIEKKAHTLTAHAKVDSTCTATGTEAYWSCDVCEKLFSNEDATTEIEAPVIIEKKAHTLTTHAKVDSTCTATGTEAYWSCDVCEKLFSDEEAQNEIEAPIVIAKKPHTLTAHAKVDATCTATGTEAYWRCDVCEKLFSDEDAQNEIEAPVVIGKKAHTLTAHAKVDSTCTATGNEAYWSCDECEKLFSDEETQNEIEAPIVIAKKAHTLTAHAKVDSTCTATGTEAYWSCDVCEKLFSDEEAQNEIEAPIIIEKKAHTLTAHAKVDSTCTATGTEAYWECGICHKLFSDEEAQNEINAPVVIEKKAHALTAHPKVDSTCTATGTEAYWECSVCHNLFSDEEGRTEIDEPVVIAAKGHDWNETVYEWSADNTSITATYTCIYDESHSKTETVGVTSAIVSPGETTEGSVIYTSGEFTKEGFSIQTKQFVIPALGNMSVLRLPGMLDAIEQDAFSGLACQAVLIPDGCTSIGKNAFAGCVDLLYVRIPSSVTGWPSSAFAGCNENLVIDWAGE